jgi:hypothetical protein
VLEGESLNLPTIAAAVVFAVATTGAAHAAAAEQSKTAPKSETAKADQNRRKPLQRCDELKDKAQLECLRKARERIVQAREKREAAVEKRTGGSAK